MILVFDINETLLDTAAGNDRRPWLGFDPRRQCGIPNRLHRHPGKVIDP